MLTRRHFIRTTTALFAASAASPLMASTWPDAAQKAAWDAEVEAGGPNPWGLHQRFLPQRIVANDGLVPGDIHVDAVARYHRQPLLPVSARRCVTAWPSAGAIFTSRGPIQ